MSTDRLLSVSSAVVALGAFVAIRLELGPPLLSQLLLSIAVVGLIAQGADWLVDAACRIAQSLGVSHLVIGLTVVAFGTSAPEMAASLVAGFQGNGDITIANVVGSNVFNICFILGGVAVLVRDGLKTDSALVRRDGPVLLGAAVALFLFVGGLPGVQPAPSSGLWPELLNLQLEPLEGLCLVGGLAAYLVYLYRSKGGSAEELEAERRASIEAFGHASWRDIPLLLLGLLAVVGGCHLLVGHADVADGKVVGYGALWFARTYEVPDYVVGVTIIAAGTSAPELVVSMVAALRGAFGLSAGNLIGSDIFNMLGVVGVAGLILQPPLADRVMLSESAVWSLLAPSAVVFITIIFMRTHMRITRLEGLCLVAIGVVRWVADFATKGQFGA